MPRGQIRFKTARFHRPLFQQIDYQPIPFRPRANDSFSFPFLCHIAPPLSGHLFPVTVLPLSPLFSTTAPFSAFRCRCGMSLSAAPLIQAFWTALPLMTPSTTAPFPAFRCRCGMSLSAAPLIQAFWAALPLMTPSTTAPFSAFRCRCGLSLSAAPLIQAFWAALPLMTLSTTAPFPAFCCRCGIY